MGSRSSHTIILFDPAIKLGGTDEHCPEKAKEFLARIGKDPIDLGEGYLESSFRIPDNETWVGAYSNGYIISNFDVSNSMICKDKFSKKIIDFAPNAQITAVTLHSVSNAYGYARYENGNLIRSRSGGDGEEYNNDGEKIINLETFDSEDDEFDDDPWIDAEPAALAFFDSCFLPEIAKNEAYYDLKMTKFKWKPYGFWSFLFG